ncbi:MAG TPA: TAXI family TRAP transporter solute-binding subunit [Rhodocyclaceae bacterium]|nr:TAXI family TRAP transporter solute-binding subunit [Rhodocyclaceae bacterium]
MSSRLARGRPLLAAAVALQLSTALTAEPTKLLTGPQSTTQWQVGRDLAQRVADPAGISLEVVTTDGPTQSLQRLRDDGSRGGGLKLVLLQADVAQAYLAAAERGNAEAATYLTPMRVIAPLYEEELYFIVRSDSGLGSIQDIQDARINVGPLEGGTALAVSTLYRLLFETPIPGGKTSFLDHEEALAKLITSRTVDVVAILADQPTKLIANMKPEARRFVRLLKFDASHPRSAAVLQTFSAATIRATSYPNLLAEDMPALASRIYLVAHGYRQGEDDELLARLARGWCQNLPRLQAEGHAKWREVEIGLPALKPGWQYAPPSAQEIAFCK